MTAWSHSNISIDPPTILGLIYYFVLFLLLRDKTYCFDEVKTLLIDFLK